MIKAEIHGMQDVMVGVIAFSPVSFSCGGVETIDEEEIGMLSGEGDGFEDGVLTRKIVPSAKDIIRIKIVFMFDRDRNVGTAVVMIVFGITFPHAESPNAHHGPNIDDRVDTGIFEAWLRRGQGVPSVGRSQTVRQ